MLTKEDADAPWEAVAASAGEFEPALASGRG